MIDPFKTYLQSLQADLARGNASEHTHRPALKTLLESLGERLTATNEPLHLSIHMFFRWILRIESTITFFIFLAIITVFLRENFLKFSYINF